MCFFNSSMAIVLNYSFLLLYNNLDIDVCDVAKKSIHCTLFINVKAIT